VVVAALVSTAAPAGAAAVPTLTNQASSSGWPVGVAISDSVTLGSGTSPTGTMTFSLYSPLDPTCSGAPLFTSTKAVNGNGYYASASFVTQLAGTYRWTAAYSGDANNYAVVTPCGLSSATVTVAKRTPTLSNAASPLSSAGGLSTKATLNGANPTGTITFRLWGPNNMMCAGAPVFTTTAAVSGSGTYTSAPFTPSAAGTYQWVVNYGGDANNLWAGTTCADPASAVTVSSPVTSSPVPPAGVSIAATPTTVVRGGQLTVSWSGIASPTSGDWLALYRAGTSDYFYGVWAMTGAKASGSVTLTVPATTTPGDYNVRLFTNNTFQRIAISSNIAVS
jgi:hypothetical protein